MKVVIGQIDGSAGVAGLICGGERGELRVRGVTWTSLRDGVPQPSILIIDLQPSGSGRESRVAG